jgi:hypothetical protein
LDRWRAATSRLGSNSRESEGYSVHLTAPHIARDIRLPK